ERHGARPAPRRRPGVEAGAAGTWRDVRLGPVRDPGVRAACLARRRGGARGRGDRDPAEPARADVDAVADEYASATIAIGTCRCHRPSSPPRSITMAIGARPR